MPIIGDDNWQQFAVDTVIDGEIKTRGLIPNDWNQNPAGSFGTPFNIPLIPESEWRERIEHQERTRSSLVHLADDAGLKVLDQNGTNYCWINGTIRAMELFRLANGMPTVKLSPASVGAPIKNYRNEGGWGIEGLRYLTQYGAVPVSMWPANAIDRRYDTAESKAIRGQFMVKEWFELPARSFEALATCLLLNIPVSAGYNWWGHQICCVRLVVQANGDFGAEIDNSWGTSWGTNGRGILTRSKATPDDVAVAPRSVTPSSYVDGAGSTQGDWT